MALSTVERRRQQAAIERAKAALEVADRIVANYNKPLPTRKQLRERGLLGQPKVEITGVFALGTSPTDHLSWDTTSLPVIARPRKR